MCHRAFVRVVFACLLSFRLGGISRGAPSRSGSEASAAFGLATGVVLLLAAACGAGLIWWSRRSRARGKARFRELTRALSQAEQTAVELRRSENHFRAMIEGLSVGVTLHAPDGKIIAANPGALALLGRSRETLLGVDSIDLWRDALSEEGTPLGPGVDPIQTVIAMRRPVRDMVMGLRQPGADERAWLLVSAEPRLAPDGTLSDIVCTFNDITERRRAHEQIRHLAYHDALTQLPNRELFLDRLGVALVQAQRRKRGVALLFIDLDDFKVINDSLGHSVGDAVLRVLAQRLKASIREADTVARFGGDEFTVLLPGVHEPEDVARLARKLRDAIRRPISIDQRALVLTASVGVTVFPRDGRDAETLIKNADVAMYRAKELGRDQTEFFTAVLGARVRDLLEIDARLREAVASGALELHYQPVVELTHGRIESYEALVRWRDPKRGLIPPEEFIPAAEAAMGAIHEVGAWVLKTVCRDLREFSSELGESRRVAVNLSARQFHTGDIVEQVRIALEEAGIAPHNLELEITESVALHGQESTEDALRRLKALGVRLAIDDFGTGYSSLSYLRRFPVDTLKVDRSFVRDAAINPDASGITRVIIGVGHQLGLHVVAEGVETIEQLRLLRLMNCDAAQGFLFSAAVPLSQLERPVSRIAHFWSREFPRQ